MRIFALLVVSALTAAGASERSVVGVDPRVELFSIISRLAGYSEYNQGQIRSYNTAIDAWFAPSRNHAAVQMARDLRQRGISYDAVASISIHVTDVETLAERVPFDRPGIALDSRWRVDDARRFLVAARRFVADSRFTEFLESQKALIEGTNERMREALEKMDFEWFERFYGPHKFRFHVVPALANGPNSYGPRMFDGETGEVYSLVGVPPADAEGTPRFGTGTVSLLVHEFSHSFVNPLVDQYYSQMEGAGNRLFEAVREPMRAQGYGTGKTVLAESLVRAASGRYAWEHDGPAGGDRAIDYEQTSRSFWWTGELCVVLGEYERNREEYPVLERFMVRVSDFFEEASRTPREMMTRYEARRPTVIDVSVVNGAQDVYPLLTQIVVRFSRPMLAKTSVLERAPDLFPKIEKAEFDESRTACTITVKLEPERDYEFSLNRMESGWFASDEGVSLRPYTVWFRTRPL